jgi:lipopolysaccharide heptosyltransferase II
MIKRMIQIAVCCLAWLLIRPFFLARSLRPVPAKKIDRILVLAWGGIGNALLFTPALKNLRKAMPRATIVAIVSQQGAKELLEGSGLVDTVVMAATETVQGAYAIAHTVAAPDKTTLFMCMAGINPIAGSILSFASRAQYRVGENGRMEGFLYTHSVRVNPGKHEVARNLDLLKRAGIPVKDDELVFSIPDDIRRATRATLAREWGITADSFISIAPGSGPHQLFKRWPAEYFAELARLLRDRGFEVALIGDKGERALCEEIRRSAGEGVYNMSGRFSMTETAALIESSRLVVSNDSAPMHVAAALKIPVVAIFGPTLPCKNAPWKVPHKIVRMSLPCSPCYRFRPVECPYELKCLRDLKPIDVIRAVEELGSETGGLL